MTIGEVLAQANRGDIASRDINVYGVLKNKVLFDYFDRVGDASWRRRDSTIPITVASGRSYDLPEDFLKVQEIYYPGKKDDPLKYIGEDPSARAQAEASTESGRPAAYWITQDGDKIWKRVRFDRDPDASYTAYYTYLMYPRLLPEADLNQDLAVWVPEQFHWGFVEGVRAEIFLDRFGIGDDRYLAAMQAFDYWVAKGIEHAELARQNFMVFAN